jgi:hypothetical protein
LLGKRVVFVKKKIKYNINRLRSRIFRGSLQTSREILSVHR